MTQLDGQVSAAAGQARVSPERVRSRLVTIGVVGLGYAGLPLALGFARAGFTVIGVDRDEQRVRDLAEGIPQVETISWDDLLALGKLRLATDYLALAPADVIVVCVATPLTAHGTADLLSLDLAVDQVSAYACDGRIVVVESTVPPGTIQGRVAARIASLTGRQAGRDYHLAHAPERINPGDGRWNLANTPRVLGGVTRACAESARLVYAEVCEAAVLADSVDIAELSKLFENTFRLVNIALVNELSDFCRTLGIPVRSVLDAAATKPYGFLAHWPGPGAGGECIPVDPVFLARAARESGSPMRLVELARQLIVSRPRELVLAIEADLGSLAGQRALVLGVSYKPEVADARNSPGAAMLAALAERGARVAYCDPLVGRLDLGDDVLVARPWLAAEAAEHDLVILATDHAVFADRAVLGAARLVYDTRNFLPPLPNVRRV